MGTSPAVAEGQEAEEGNASKERGSDDLLLEDSEGRGAEGEGGGGDECDEDQGVHSYLDHFREADTFFLLLNKLIRITGDICSGVYTPEIQGDEEVFLSHLSAHCIRKKKFTFSKVTSEATTLMKKCVKIIETYQNLPTLLDKHLPLMVEPITDLLSVHLKSITPLTPNLSSPCSSSSDPSIPLSSIKSQIGREDKERRSHHASLPLSNHTIKSDTPCNCSSTHCEDSSFPSSDSLKAGISACQELASCVSLRLLLHFLYALCKVRGYKVVRPLFSQRPELLEILIDLSISLYQKEIGESASHSAHPEESSTLPLSSSTSAYTTSHSHSTTKPPYTPGPQASMMSEKHSSGEERNKQLRKDLLELIDKDHDDLKRMALQLPLWSSHYTLLIWISLAVLAPFKLAILDSSVSSSSSETERPSREDIGASLEQGRKTESSNDDVRHQKGEKKPSTQSDSSKLYEGGSLEEGGLSMKILSLTEAYIRYSSTNASDAACVVLARFFSRSDVVSRKNHKLFSQFLLFCRQILLPSEGIAQETSPASSGMDGNEKDRLHEDKHNKEGTGADDTQMSQRPSLPLASQQNALLPLFAQANALRALNEILKFIDRDAVLPELPQIFSVLGLGSSGVHTPGETTTATTTTATARWGVIAENSSLFRKLRCSCAARLATLLLPPMDHRSLRWRYTPNARCLVSLLLQSQNLSSPSQAKEVGEQRGVLSSEQTPSASDEEEDEDEEEVPEEVEDVIDLLLNGISDKDSTVRWACAKGVARVVLRLPKDFADQVVANILDSLNSTPLSSSSLSSKRLWHGHMLGLAELLRRGLVSLSRLSSCCTLLRLALSFHTEEGIGGQGGGEDQAETALRDAACYAVWSIARSYYHTSELEKELLPLSHSLLLVSLFDRDVNCRRAAAAAFQEVEGRQGGIPEGLRIITHADFFALATRRSSYLHVAPKIAGLSESYAQLLLNTLSSLLLSGVLDQDLRILAAASLKKITAMYRELCVKELLPSFVKKLSMPDQPLSIRHGTLLGVTAIIEGISSSIGTWRRPFTQEDERKTEVESRLSSSRKSASNATSMPETSAHSLHTSPSTPTTAAPAEKDEKEVREVKDGRFSSSTSPSSPLEDEEEERRRSLRESLLPESVQGDIRQIVVKVEKRREYRGKGGDLVRIGVCKLIQALASSPLIVFKSATSRRYLATLMDGLKHFSEEVQLSSAEALRPLLFLRMATTEILESFLPSLLASLKKPDEHIAARRGYVLALATLPPAVYRHCYKLATLREKEKDRSARIESDTVNISEEDTQRRKEEAMKEDSRECTMKNGDRKAPPACSSRLSRGVKEESTSTETPQRVSQEEEATRHLATSGEEGGFLFDILRDEATSKMPLNDPGLNDAHTRRNALIAYAFALRAILSLSTSSSFTQENPCSSPENADDKEESGGGEQDFLISKSFWDETVETLTVCCSDFQSDRRGDVGSWIREVAVEVICFLLENVNVDAPQASILPLSSQHAPQRGQQQAEKQNKETSRNDQKKTCSSHAEEKKPSLSLSPFASESGETISVWEKLLGLVIRMALENLGRTRSRATFLLYRMTAPLASSRPPCSSSGAERREETCEAEGDGREARKEEGRDSSSGGCPRPKHLPSSSPSPFRIEWIWGRVFHDYSYELGPADIPPSSGDTPPAEAASGGTGENPCCPVSSPTIRRCLISHLRPEPTGLRFLQESLLPIAEKQRKAAEETKPVLPFHDLHLSDLSQPISLPLSTASLPSSAQKHTMESEPSSSSFIGAPLDGLSSSSLKKCTTSSVSNRSELSGQEDRKKEGVMDKEKKKQKRDDDEECWMSSFDFLLDLSVIDGGYASLHKTRKSGVVLRLPFFTNPSVTYPRLLIFLLFSVYSRRAAEGTCLGVGGALGSSADQTIRALLSFFTHLRELLHDLSKDQAGQTPGLIPEREDFLLEKKTEKEAQERLFPSLPLSKQSGKTDGISALYLDVLHAIQAHEKDKEKEKKTEDHESSSGKVSRASPSSILSMVSESLVDVLSCRDQKKKMRSNEEDKLRRVDESDFFDKLRTSALKTCIILASNDILTCRDATRMLSVLMDASLTSGPSGRSFQFIRDQCEAFIVLASSRSIDEGEGNEGTGVGFVTGDSNEVLSIKKIALCKAVQFLKHRFPKIRQFAAETLYSSLVLSLSSLASCLAKSTPTPTRPPSQEKDISSSEEGPSCVTTGDQRQLPELPKSDGSPYRLSEQEIDEVTDILTLTPWLEMQYDPKSHSVRGDDAHARESTETDPIARLISLFGIEKEWQAIQPKKPRK